MREGYIPKEQRKKILLLADDLRLHSGIATMSREIVYQTCHKYNWVQIGAAMQHPDRNSLIDISKDLATQTEVPDASAMIYPVDGYGNPDILRTILRRESPDGLIFFTDPRYWGWLFSMENEVRRNIPMMYLNIWDDLPAPLYNESFYESCDALFAISKQTLNINRMVLGDKAKSKVLKYIPHGINTEVFHPVNEDDKEDFEKYQNFKSEILEKQTYDFIVFFNSRNIRRKSASDLIAAYRVFCDKLTPEDAKKCLLLMHTDPVDENGTNLYEVAELFSQEHINIKFTSNKFTPQYMKYLYNIADITCLPSSNEGWGLSLTESLICGTMIIANVTGGMQDQMRFEDENGQWIDFNEEFCSNHFGTYKKCGEWAIPIFPSNLSLVGSLPTPYIWDDRLDFRELADGLLQAYNMGPEERKRRGQAGRQWVISDEAKMTGEAMGQSMVEAIEETFKVWKPRKNFEFIKTEPLKPKQLVHKLIY